MLIALWCFSTHTSQVHDLSRERAKKNSNLEFHIGKETIDIVHEYTYLGTRISSTGNFNISDSNTWKRTLFLLFFPVNSHLLKFVSLCNDLRSTNLLSNHADDAIDWLW